MIKLIGKYQDPDSTQKFVFKDENGTIEITRINTKKERDIFCVPTLYGCSLGCSFCFLTTLNVSKTNKPIKWETIKECLKSFENTKPKRQISLMGAGDPALNQKFIDDCCSEEESVSLASIFPILLKKQPKNLKIHYSLHSTNNKKRLEMMPSAKVPIESVFQFLKAHDGGKEVHYTLIDGQNDSEEELIELKKLSKQYQLPIKFLHFKESGENKASPKLDHWIKTLSEDTKVEFYCPPGAQVQGSCGQFTNFFYKDNFESLHEFKAYHESFAI